MKLYGVTNERKVKDSIDRLYKNLSKYPHKVFEITYGGPEGEQQIQICYSENKEFWWGSKVEHDKQKYWNPVGFEFPNPKNVNRSDCEFNCAIKGLGNHAGLFAKDIKGNTFLVHNGKAGGNTIGTTIEGFRNFYKDGQMQIVDIDEDLQDFYVVSDIDSNNLLENIIKYAQAITDFKKNLRNNLKNKK